MWLNFCLTMANLYERVVSFFRYWYFRYTIVTELYIVDEKWERHFINVFLLTMFALLFIFNYHVLVPTTTNLFIRQ